MAHFAFNNSTLKLKAVNEDASMQVSSPRKRKAKQTFSMDLNTNIAKRHSPWNHQKQQPLSERKMSLRSATKFRPIQHQQEDQNVNNCNKNDDNIILTATIKPAVVSGINKSKANSINTKSNDIVIPEGVASKEDVVNVLSSDLIKQSKNPSEELKLTLKHLNSAKWSESFYAIESVRRLAIFNKELLLPHLQMIVAVTLQNSINLRSAVAKNAILALNDIFKSMKESILCQDDCQHINNFNNNNKDNESNAVSLMDSIVSTLINRTVADKKFLRDNSNKALHTLVSTVPRKETLYALLKCANHKRPSARGRVSSFVEKCLNQMGKNEIQKMFSKEISMNNDFSIENLHQLPLYNIMKELTKLYNGRVQESRKGATGALKHIFAAVGNTKFQFILSKLVHPTEGKRILGSMQRLASKSNSSVSRRTNKSRKDGLSLKDKIKQRKKMMMMAAAGVDSGIPANNPFGCVVMKNQS
jgi:hypothetical protein